MTDRKTNLTRRKILASMGAVGAAGAAAGMGTSALFSDTESFENNAITAGELDLNVDWEEHYSYPQLYGFENPAAGLDVTRSEPAEPAGYVGLPDPEDPVVWVAEDDLDAYMSNTAIEAYPDPDNDGEQEVETESFTYRPCEDGADLPEDLSSALRTNNDATSPGESLIKLEDVKPGDFGEFTLSFHLCDNPGYVWLQAANVSYNENGYTEPEPEDEDGSGDLAENIKTVWWYDARGDNVPPRTDCEEALYLTDSGGDDATELYEVDLDDGGSEAALTQLLPNNQNTDIDNGNFTQTDAIATTPNGDKIVFYDKESQHLGEYHVGSGAFTDHGSIAGSPSGVVLAGYSPSGTLWAASQDDNHLYTVDRSGPSVTDQGDTGIDLSGADLAFSSDGTMYIWSSSSGVQGLYKIDDPSSDPTANPVDSGNVGNKSTDVTGMAIRDAGSGAIVVSDNQTDTVRIIDRTDGSVQGDYQMTLDGSEFDHIFGDMTAGQLCGEVFRRGNEAFEGGGDSLRDDLDTLQSSPVPLDGNRASAFTEFGGSGSNDSRECFPAGVTHYIGFGWWLPEDVGNEVQGDSVSFDLGFYTEQCRHNDGSKANQT